MQAQDEEALKEEEEEALAIQRKAAEALRDQDLGVASSSGEESDAELETELQVFALLNSLGFLFFLRNAYLEGEALEKAWHSLGISQSSGQLFTNNSSHAMCSM